MRKQSGIALITTLLLLLLMSAMVVGFMLLVTEGQRLSGMNNEQSRAFYGAESGMEKLTADLGSLFATTYAPAAKQVDDLATRPPVLPSSTGVSYVDVLGNSTYSIAYPKDGNGNPLSQFAQIRSGSSAFQGMSALETTYTLTVAARTATGGEAKLVRTTQTVGIPLFQFGIFSDTDLSFFPGPNFDFGGRVHTNGNLFLDSGGPAGATPTQSYPPTIQLWLRSPVTASKAILRDCLSNSNPESATGRHPGSVEITNGGSLQALGFRQGSLNSCLGSGVNSSWGSISDSFNGNLRSGVKPLDLTIVLLGNGNSKPVDMIRRPVAGEQGANPGVLGERYFSQASLRVLLSDNASDITGLDCVSSGAPFNLADLAVPVAIWPASATALKTAMTAAGTTLLPLAASGAAGATVAAGYNSNDGYWQPINTPIITGFIKIDAQTSYGSPCGSYTDVTKEILSLGYAGRNLNPVSLTPPQLPGLPGAQIAPSACLDPHPNAVIRLERVRDNPSNYASATGPCGVTATLAPQNPSDYWPNALYDTREGYNRQPAPALNNQVTLGGIMNYIELDVKNLAKWFSGTIGTSGPNTQDPAVAPNNFVVYVSDRRGNYLPAGTAVGSWPPLSPSTRETGEYGYFDLVNSGDPKGCPDNKIEPAPATGGPSAEDPAGSGVLAIYGENTFPNGLVNSIGVITASTLFSNLPNAAVQADALCLTGGSGGISPWPRSFLKQNNDGRENTNALFRRAVKLVNGSLITLPVCPGTVSCGLTITTENPMYIQGDYNANSAGGGFTNPSVATSVAADAVTILSVNWNDVNSFASPFNSLFNRTGTTTYVRTAVVAGKQVSFQIPAWDNAAIDGSQDFGTDGGVHNFLRFLERWNGTLNYEGSIVSLFYSRQATGLFNSGGNNYSPPTRGYKFDVNFLDPTLLPPRTPMFRDVNTTGFTQLLLPTQ
ncbi:MAG TPA: PilX N-terminal domain-containing pilus assembly protein [Candidatus Limnocylindria bacterium]|nr:PilX N-terminal domain-containing pilus assembly protein [Candidatus Limnocylindria bacterium]